MLTPEEAKALTIANKDALADKCKDLLIAAITKAANAGKFTTTVYGTARQIEIVKYLALSAGYGVGKVNIVEDYLQDSSLEVNWE